MKFDDVKKKYESPMDVLDVEMFNDVLFLVQYINLLHEYINMEQESKEMRQVVSEIHGATWH